MLIDATMVMGKDKRLSCTIETTENGVTFKPFDLTGYVVVFQVLGAPTANAKVLLEHRISEVSDIDTIGQITNAAQGIFEFCITAKESEDLGLGVKPIMLSLASEQDGVIEYVITEGKLKGEFNKIQILQV